MKAITELLLLLTITVGVLQAQALPQNGDDAGDMRPVVATATATPTK